MRIDTTARSGGRALLASLGARPGVCVIALALMAWAGCARTSVEHVDVRATGMPRPDLIIVHDFAVSPEQVALDQGVASRIGQMVKDTPEAEAQQKVGQDVARAVTEKLVAEILKLGIPAEPAATAAPVAGPTLSVEGQFLSVDEGNRTRRMIIGFGAGASEVRTLVQIYETTGEGRRMIEDFYTTVKSSRKPGFGPMAGVGAMAGRAATSAGVSAGVGLATERSQTVEGDATHTAEEIAKVLSQYFAQQGWIEPDKAK
ncbi:MAG TPA: DUF4410 domain-containing protein [Candidatus Methylomirabilis sp.]|nr:DUF4410 domain-containing protein [Candidatus Methylomirabilis sp.]